MPEPAPTSSTLTPSRWKRWVALLMTRERGESLALFRIAVGLVVLNSVGMAVVRGVAPVVWLDQADGGYRSLGEPPWLFAMIGGVTPATMWAVVGVCLVGAVMMIVGLGGRIAVCVTLVTTLNIAAINPHTSGWDDALITNALWLLVLARSTATLSLDSRLRTGRWTSDALIPAWPRYVAVVQIVIVYTMTAVQKVSILWTPAGDFAAIWYMLQEPSWQRFDMRWLADFYPLTQIATAMTWLWEWSAPLLLVAMWCRRREERESRESRREGNDKSAREAASGGSMKRDGRLRRALRLARRVINRLPIRGVFVAVGVVMHVSVYVLIGLGPFTWISLSFYICLFRPTEWRRPGARVSGWLSGWHGQADSFPLAHEVANERQAEPSETQSPARIITRRADGARLAWRDHFVTAFVTLHLIAITLMAIPNPGHPDRERWQSPLFQSEFAGWTRRLNGWGIDVSQEGLAAFAWDFASTFATAHDAATDPLQPYATYCGTAQGWFMFVGSNLYPTRLHVDVELDGEWRPAFVERHPEHDWRSRQFDHEHLRKAIYVMLFFEDDAVYHELCAWIAAQASADFPDATRVRVRVHRLETPTAEQVRAGFEPRGEFEKTRVIRLR